MPAEATGAPAGAYPALGADDERDRVVARLGVQHLVAEQLGHVGRQEHGVLSGGDRLVAGLGLRDDRQANPLVALGVDATLEAQAGRRRTFGGLDQAGHGLERPHR